MGERTKYIKSGIFVNYSAYGGHRDWLVLKNTNLLYNFTNKERWPRFRYGWALQVGEMIFDRKYNLENTIEIKIDNVSADTFIVTEPLGDFIGKLPGEISYGIIFNINLFI